MKLSKTEPSNWELSSKSDDYWLADYQVVIAIGLDLIVNYVNVARMKQVTIIAGATSMIGRATAKLFSENGAHVVLAGRSKENLDDLAHMLPGKATTIAVDFRSEIEIEKMVRQTIHELGKIDSVIQNVAIYPWKSIEDLSPEEWRDTMAVNLTSAFLTTHYCIAEMKKNSTGHFLFMSSIAGENIGLANMSAYSASKAALNGFMRTCALEFAPYNITANSISPGKIWDESTLSKDEIAKHLRPVPLKRFQEPIDFAEMACFLCSSKAKNITGQNIIIDGGQSIHGQEDPVR